MFTLSYVEGFLVFVAFIVAAGIVTYLFHIIDKLEKELNESSKAYEFMQVKCKEANSDKQKYSDIIDLLSERENH